jgi:hypothetical protein
MARLPAPFARRIKVSGDAREIEAMRESAVEVASHPSNSILSPDFVDDGGTRLQPEGRLMLAVLEAAVSDFQKYATASSGRGRRLFSEADAWFGSSATDQPLAFESICQALALEPSFIRTGLHRWCTARLREPRAARNMLHLPFRRVTGGRHMISAPRRDRAEVPPGASLGGKRTIRGEPFRNSNGNALQLSDASARRMETRNAVPPERDRDRH